MVSHDNTSTTDENLRSYFVFGSSVMMNNNQQQPTAAASYMATYDINNFANDYFSPSYPDYIAGFTGE